MSLDNKHAKRILIKYTSLALRYLGKLDSLGTSEVKYLLLCAHYGVILELDKSTDCSSITSVRRAELSCAGLVLKGGNAIY